MLQKLVIGLVVISNVWFIINMFTLGVPMFGILIAMGDSKIDPMYIIGFIVFNIITFLTVHLNEKYDLPNRIGDNNDNSIKR